MIGAISRSQKERNGGIILIVIAGLVITLLYFGQQRLSRTQFFGNWSSNAKIQDKPVKLTINKDGTAIMFKGSEKETSTWKVAENSIILSGKGETSFGRLDEEAKTLILPVDGKIIFFHQERK